MKTSHNAVAMIIIGLAIEATNWLPTAAVVSTIFRDEMKSYNHTPYGKRAVNGFV